MSSVFFFVRHGFVYFGNDVDVHCILVFFFLEVPSWLPFLSLRSVPFDNPLDLMVVVVDLQRFFVPFGQRF